MKDLECDVAIIGAGTAGLAAERSARRRKARTLLIDEHFAGTTCAVVGCMPSKLLIAAADAAHAVSRAGQFGIEVGAPRVNGAAVMERVQRLRDAFADGARASFGELPEGVLLRGRARFASRTTLVLEDGRQVKARAVVIATGSRPRVPKAFEAVSVLTNESIFELTDLPRSIAIIGAGVEGVEIAQALARLGVETMLFDEKEQIAGLHDEVVAKELRTILAGEFPIVLGVDLAARAAQGGIELTWSGHAEGKKVFERVFVAAGRPPSVKGLDLEKADLALDEHGVPKFDDTTMQCGSAPIFLAGDVSHDRPVLHEASCEGTIAGRNAATFPDVRPGVRAPVLSIVFTDPAAATVGRVPKDDEPHVIGTTSYQNQGRAKAFARNAGRLCLYGEEKTGKLLGATLAGPGAEHTAHLLAWAIQKEMTASDLLDLPFYHPTYEEGLKTALREICTKVDSPVPADRDDGTLPGS